MRIRLPSWRTWAHRWGFRLFLLAVLPLCGCLEFYQEISLSPDGSGRAVIKYAAKESLMQSGPTMKFFSAQEGRMMLDPERIREYFQVKEGINLRRVSVDREDDLAVVHLQIEFDDIELLSDQNLNYQWKLEGPYKVLRIELDKATRTGKPGKFQKMIAQSFNDRGFTFKVRFPRKIAESNAKSVDWSVAEWFVPLGYFLDPDAPPSKSFYAKIPATFWERVHGWFAGLWGD